MKITVGFGYITVLTSFLFLIVIKWDSFSKSSSRSEREGHGWYPSLHLNHLHKPDCHRGSSRFWGSLDWIVIESFSINIMKSIENYFKNWSRRHIYLFHQFYFLSSLYPGLLVLTSQTKLKEIFELPTKYNHTKYINFTQTYTLTHALTHTLMVQLGFFWIFIHCFLKKFPLMFSTNPVKSLTL